MHLASYDDVEMDADKRITKGSQIGIMSNTNTNPDPGQDQNGMEIHLHISIGEAQTTSKAARTYLDPKAFLPF